MQGYAILQASTSYPLVFLMISSSDHITPLAGATPSVTISKNGAAFAAPAGAISEIGSGWYRVAGNATDAATLGPLILHATATGGDPTDALYTVVAYNSQAQAGLGLTNLDINVGSRMATFATPPNFSALAITAAGAVTAGTVGDKAGYSLATPPPTAAQVATALWADVTAGDFAVAGSPGKMLMGQLGGAFGAGTSVYTAAALANAPTGGGLTAAAVATAVWADVTAGDFAVAGSPGKVLMGQLGGAFTAGTSVYTAAALANAPTGTGGGGGLALATVLSAPRAVDGVVDGSITVNDALWGAICGAAGKETVVGTTYTVMTPSTGTAIRTFTLDSATTPTQRT